MWSGASSCEAGLLVRSRVVPSAADSALFCSRYQLYLVVRGLTTNETFKWQQALEKAKRSRWDWVW